MLLNRQLRTTCTIVACSILAMLTTACSLIRDYRSQPRAEDKLSFALTIEDNQLVLTSARMDGQEGKFVLATGHQVSSVDRTFAAEHFEGGRIDLVIGERFSTRIDPMEVELGTAGDALLASDLWGDSAISIDYLSGLMTLSHDHVERPRDMAIYAFNGPPTVPLIVNGTTYQAIVDTSLPDTVVLPRSAGASSRSNADVQLAGRSFDQIDIAWEDTSSARVGNRVLSRFLLIINYGDRWVGLWPDPRINTAQRAAE